MSPEVEPRAAAKRPYSVRSFVELGRDGSERNGATLGVEKQSFMLRSPGQPVEPEAIAVTALFGPVRLESLVLELTLSEQQLERLYAAYGFLRKTRRESAPRAGRRQVASLFLAEEELLRAAKDTPAQGPPEVRLAALMERDPQLFVSLDRWTLKGGASERPSRPEEKVPTARPR